MLRTACRFLTVWFLLAANAEAATSQARPGAQSPTVFERGRDGRPLLLADLQTLTRTLPFAPFADPGRFFDASSRRPPAGNPVAPPRRRYDALIRNRALAEGLDPRLVKSVIEAESSFRPEVRSRAGALGLMQLMPATAEEMGVPRTALFDPARNIEAGVKYLAHLFRRILRRFRLGGISPMEAPKWIVRRVLAAYNAGPRFLYRSRWFKATRRYVAKVMGFYESDGADLRERGPRLRAPLAAVPENPAGPHDRVEYTGLRRAAGVAELADALDSKSSGSDTVWVRVPPPANSLKPFKLPSSGRVF